MLCKAPGAVLLALPGVAGHGALESLLPSELHDVLVLPEGPCVLTPPLPAVEHGMLLQPQPLLSCPTDLSPGSSGTGAPTWSPTCAVGVHGTPQSRLLWGALAWGGSLLGPDAPYGGGGASQRSCRTQL